MTTRVWYWHCYLFLLKNFQSVNPCELDTQVGHTSWTICFNLNRQESRLPVFVPIFYPLTSIDLLVHPRFHACAHFHVRKLSVHYWWVQTYASLTAMHVRNGNKNCDRNSNLFWRTFPYEYFLCELVSYNHNILSDKFTLWSLCIHMKCTHKIAILCLHCGAYAHIESTHKSAILCLHCGAYAHIGSAHVELLSYTYIVELMCTQEVHTWNCNPMLDWTFLYFELDSMKNINTEAAGETCWEQGSYTNFEFACVKSKCCTIRLKENWWFDTSVLKL